MWRKVTAVELVDRDSEVILTCLWLVVRGLVRIRSYRLVCVLFWGVQQLTFEQYLHKIAPQGVYASGKGSSAVGLTVYVTRNADTKELVLERYVANL